MSDDERALSDDDCDDLFESEPEDQVSEVEHSMDLPALSMHSLYANSLLPPENYAENSGCETDQSDAGGFDMDEVAMNASLQPIPKVNEAEDEEFEVKLDHQDDNSAEAETCNSNIAGGADQSSRSDEKADNATSEEGVGTNQTLIAISRCGSPISEPVAPQDGGDEKDIGGNEFNSGQGEEALLDRDCVPSSTSQADKQNLSTPIDNSREDIDQTSAQISLPKEADQLTHVPDANATEASIDCIDTVIKPSPRENSDEKTEIFKLSSPDPLKIAAPAYTVESLFPVVHESVVSFSVSQSQRAPVVPLSNTSMNGQMPSLERRKRQHGSNPDKSIASRLAALQSQLDAAHSALANATRTSKLQISMSESDNKKLSQRNTRLKNQLSVTIADLQRTNTEMAKLKTENELYAAKLPRLQAELLQETSQVDETQAHSVQTQLVLTQLKARSHVLQTRNLTLETQNNKLTQQLRECRQQLQRKVATLQQQSEKASKTEFDVHELKNTHGQEKLEWKSRLASALQRFERDKAKLEAEWKAKERTELREAKERAEKAAKKRRAAELSAAKLEEQLKHHKHELSSASDTVQRSANEMRTLESLLRKAHRTEATLRNDLAACRTRLRSLQDDKRRRLTRPATVPTSRRRLERQIPIELLLRLSDSSDDEDGNQERKCCGCCLTSPKSIEPQSPLSSPVCNDCPELRNQLRQLRDEIRRVRALHSAELHAQASVLDALLHHKKQLAVSPM